MVWILRQVTSYHIPRRVAWLLLERRPLLKINTNLHNSKIPQCLLNNSTKTIHLKLYIDLMLPESYRRSAIWIQELITWPDNADNISTRNYHTIYYYNAFACKYKHQNGFSLKQSSCRYAFIFRWISTRPRESFITLFLQHTQQSRKIFIFIDARIPLVQIVKVCQHQYRSPILP